MNTLPQFDPHSALTGLILFALFIGAIACIGWLIADYGARQAKEGIKYCDLYIEIEDKINLLAHTSENFDHIQSKIGELKALKYKDRERTEVLIRKFYLAFGKEWLKRALENKQGNQLFHEHETPDLSIAG